VLGDDDEVPRRLAVNKIQALQGKFLPHTISNSMLKVDVLTTVEIQVMLIQIASEYFKFLLIKLQANSFHQIVNLNGMEVEQPPAIKNL